MVVTKNNPVGVDAAIQSLQLAMYAELYSKWNLASDGEYDCYGRAYKTQKPKVDGFIPEVYTGGKDYKDVYLNDKVNALSFFHYEKNDYKLLNSASVSLIFWVNIPKIKPSIDHRADEEVRVDVSNFIVKYIGNSEATISTITGIDRVFAEYAGWRLPESIKHRDMHPFHCFRINFNLSYDSTQIC